MKTVQMTRAGASAMGVVAMMAMATGCGGAPEVATEEEGVTDLSSDALAADVRITSRITNYWATGPTTYRADVRISCRGVAALVPIRLSLTTAQGGAAGTARKVGDNDSDFSVRCELGWVSRQIALELSVAAAQAANQNLSLTIAGNVGAGAVVDTAPGDTTRSFRVGAGPEIRARATSLERFVDGSARMRVRLENVGNAAMPASWYVGDVYVDERDLSANAWEVNASVASRIPALARGASHITELRIPAGTPAPGRFFLEPEWRYQVVAHMERDGAVPGGMLLDYADNESVNINP